MAGRYNASDCLRIGGLQLKIKGLHYSLHDRPCGVLQMEEITRYMIFTAN